MKLLYSILITVSFIFCQPQLINPLHQDTLNYLHIPFEWSQTPNTSNYQIQISVDLEFNEIIFNENEPYLLKEVKEIFDWNNQYYWRCRGLSEDESLGQWSEVSSFITSELPDALFNLNTITYQPDLVYDGITILDELWSGHIFAIDLQGKPVWYLDSDQLFDNGLSYKLGFTYLLDNGNILGYADGRDYSLPGRAFEMGIDNELIWQGPSNLEGIGVHHDAIRLPNGNTMALTSEDQLLPIPDADWPIEVDQIVWRGDKIIEWDPSGNEVWSWSCFDHYSLEDWDYNQILMSFGLGFYDWTHSNAIWYDEQDDAVYISVRYLNRVTKIDYQTGNVIWNMGEDTPSGDAEVGNSLGFSMQHAVKILDNRNLMIYDNGNDFNPIVSRGLEISVSEDDSTPLAEIVWEYQLPDSVSSGKMSDSDRLPNGNTLLTSTHSRYLLEVSPDSQRVWEVEPYQQFSTYRGERVAGLYPQLFTVLQPQFVDSDQGVVFNIDSMNPSLIYTVSNKGFNDQIYVYALDGNGSFYYDGTINVLAGDVQDIEFIIDVDNSELSNDIVFSIYLIDSPDLIEIYPAILNVEVLSDLGDINSDSSIDIFDIIMIVDIILLNVEPTEYQLFLADYNSDGIVDVNDIVEVIEFILSI